MQHLGRDGHLGNAAGRHAQQHGRIGQLRGAAQRPSGQRGEQQPGQRGEGYGGEKARRAFEKAGREFAAERPADKQLPQILHRRRNGR